MSQTAGLSAASLYLHQAEWSQMYLELHKQAVMASRLREVTLALCSALLHSGETPPEVLHPALGAQQRTGMHLLERVQKRETQKWLGG